jgi:hypothetical protein
VHHRAEQHVAGHQVTRGLTHGLAGGADHLAIFRPPPAKASVQRLPQWSRPALSLIFGVRPNFDQGFWILSYGKANFC